MIRFLSAAAIVAAFTLATASAAQAPRDWRNTVTLSPEGGHRIGNPAAPTKLVEYASYTCSHCADFTRDAKAPLEDGLVRQGRVQLEIRNAVRDRLDLAMTLLARCGGPARFRLSHNLIFTNQKALMDKAVAFEDAGTPYAGITRPEQQLRRLSDGSGLTALMRTRGLNDAAIDRCLADAPTRDRLIAQSQAAFSEIAGTPSFKVNGRLVEAHGWAALEPELRATPAR